jgi:hypothetical protein
MGMLVLRCWIAVFLGCCVSGLLCIVAGNARRDIVRRIDQCYRSQNEPIHAGIVVLVLAGWYRCFSSLELSI